MKSLIGAQDNPFLPYEEIFFVHIFSHIFSFSLFHSQKQTKVAPDSPTMGMYRPVRRLPPLRETRGKLCGVGGVGGE